MAASAGAFTLLGNWRRGIVTVEVATTTKFVDATDASPSFADISVGGHVGALGTLSSGTLTATTVAVTRDREWPPLRPQGPPPAPRRPGGRLG